MILYDYCTPLQNVLATITDRKLQTCGSEQVLHYTAQVISVSDYYPFGMQIAGREWQSEEYRFGFNGQEKDDEYFGKGNSMTAEFWQYDARLGRRWNLDPIPQVFISDYAVFANTPIIATDIYGDKVDLSKFINKDKKNDTKKEKETETEIDYTQALIDDLEEKTGLKLNVDPNTGLLNYEKKDGKPVVRDGKFSLTARKNLIALIDDPEVTTVHFIDDDTEVTLESGKKIKRTGSWSQQGRNLIALHINQINDIIDNTNSGLEQEKLNKTTLGFAMVFFHESYHSQGLYTDNSVKGYPQGKTVYMMNIIRRELGPSYGLRLKYKWDEDGIVQFGKQGNLINVHSKGFKSLGWHIRMINKPFIGTPTRTLSGN